VEASGSIEKSWSISNQLLELQCLVPGDMALNMPWSLFGNYDSGPVFVAGFVLGGLTCLMCRFAVDFACHLRKHGIQDEKALNVDAAEKGGLELERRISLDEDLFSLEKRAFFNQVCNVPRQQPHHSACQRENLGKYLRAESINSTVNADRIAVVALCMSS
jgi:hypothetical protein